MKWKYFFFIVPLFQFCKSPNLDEMVFIEGGSLVYEKSQEEIIVSDFYISKYEVTQSQWEEVMETNPSAFKGEKYPVEMVSWYDCIEFCNKRSIQEGLEPYYIISKEKQDTHNYNDLDSVKWQVDIRRLANGYRLPTEAEWLFAASCGGKYNYLYSGSDRIDEVAWYWRNSGQKYLTGDWKWENIENNRNKTNLVGRKSPNEWGLYDMSGNVREWCWDWYEDGEIAEGYARIWKGGGWIGGDHACAIDYRGLFEANGKGADQGLRLVRNAK